jgi:NAD(P)-dependent dehydrogenase (short-subunit alcohol dehydrogenase family)
MRRALQNRRILITGASSGIGRSLAEAAAKRGMRVALAAPHAEFLHEVVSGLRARGAETLITVGDLTDPASRRAAVDAAVAGFGGLDILVNNAGVGFFGPFVDTPSDAFRRVMEVNFFAAAEMCRLALPQLVRCYQPLIVNVSSMYGRAGVPNWAAYCASKFAVCGFSEALRAEVARFGIDLMLVLPGVTNTDFGRHLVNGPGTILDLSGGTPAGVVADQILRGMEINAAEVWVGADARRLLGVRRLFPWLANWRGWLYARRKSGSDADQPREDHDPPPSPAGPPTR